MRVVYDDKQNIYVVELEDFEKTTLINTSDIAEAKEYFIENMTRLFNDAVNERLKR